MSTSNINIVASFYQYPRKMLSQIDLACINTHFLTFPTEIHSVLWEQYCLIHNQLGSQHANLFIQTLDKGKWMAGKITFNKDHLAEKTHKVIQKAIEESRLDYGYRNDKHGNTVNRQGDRIGTQSYDYTVLRDGVNAAKKVFESESLSSPTGKTHASTIARMIDPDVWERKLKQRSKQQDEQIIRDKGRIFRDGEVYSSDRNVNQFIEMQKDNQEFLKRQRVISDQGDELSLAEIAAKTVANPAHRRTEMMTRMRGTEEIAKAMGFTCLFITLTAASIFHPKRFIKTKSSNQADQSDHPNSPLPRPPQGEGGGKRHQQGYFIDNPNYQPILTIKDKDGKTQKIANTPKVSHEFIKRIMNRSIAKFKRDDINYMGYKVVEPHHDGTPHWHLAFFVHPDQKAQVIEIFTHYALMEYGDEKGAQQRRVVIKDYEAKKGSVTGYMAKYISKGISGRDVGEDYESGLDAEDSTIRLLAWKSLWGIRQFSFFGSPSVTVWRELRRIREPVASPSLETIRLAADEGHWDLFIKYMQVNFVQIETIEVKDKDGRLKKNKYGEVIERILGLKIEGLSGLEIIRTRFKQWFLVDLEKLEQRMIQGLPFQYREDPLYLQQVKKIIEKAVNIKKVCRLHQATGGVVPFSATAPLGPVGNNVTGDG